MIIPAGFIGDYQVLGHSASGRHSEIEAVASERLPDARAVYALTTRPKAPGSERLIPQLNADLVTHLRGLPKSFVRTYDVFEAQGQVCLVTDFVAGETLAQVLATVGGALPPLTAIAIAIELANAMAEAHGISDGGGRPWIHGDLCPSHVLIGYDGRIRIADFGRALIEARLSGDPRAGQPHAGYFAPERATTLKEVDARSDVYSIGLILYEMLTGEPAIQGRDEPARLERAAKPKIPRLSSKARVGELLEDLMRRVLAPNKTDRLQSAKQLADTLTALKSGKLSTWNTRAELERLLQQRFSHRARAMQTLMVRWTQQISGGNTGDLLPAPRGQVPRPRSIPPKAQEARPFVEPVILEPIEVAPTDDLSAPGLLPRPRTPLSFLRGVVWSSLGAALVIGSVPFWPAPAQASALRTLGVIAAGGHRVVQAIASVLVQLAG
jgi:serine/threonine protein kinase